MSERPARAPAAAPAWEKSGNTSWVNCPRCPAWFHVGEALLRAGDIALRCPGCAAEFKPQEAREIVEA